MKIKEIKNETKSYFYKVSSILKYYVTKVIIIILNFLFEQDRYGCLHEKYLSFWWKEKHENQSNTEKYR